MTLIIRWQQNANIFVAVTIANIDLLQPLQDQSFQLYQNVFFYRRYFCSIIIIALKEFIFIKSWS